MNLMKNVYKKAQKNPLKILYPESTEPRIIKAIKEIIDEKIAQPVLLGDFKKIFQAFKKLKAEKLLEKIEVIDFNDIDYEEYSIFLSKKINCSIEEANKFLKKEMYLSMLLLEKGVVDGVIAGSIHTTADTVRPALKIIKSHSGRRISGLFIMEFDDKVFLFADCALNINPDAKILADIAIESYDTAKFLGMNPKIALVSYSTKGSASHEGLKKISDAIKLVNKKNKKIIIDGELQIDTAIIPSVSKIKEKKSILKGKANVLIFPDLNSGNIAYKLVQRLAHPVTVGPILQGLNLPVNDLSRGCSVKEIKDVTAITVIQAQNVNKKNKSL